MKWHQLDSLSQLEQIDKESENQNILLFKHSTRCGISNTALNRIERNWKEEHSEIIKPYDLDLLNHRDISNQVAAKYQVKHESPQAIVISKGRSIFSQTHSEIRLEEILENSTRSN
jgi:bacillithiol system protein YtxJ